MILQTFQAVLQYIIYFSYMFFQLAYFRKSPPPISPHLPPVAGSGVSEIAEYSQNMSPLNTFVTWQNRNSLIIRQLSRTMLLGFVTILIINELRRKIPIPENNTFIYCPL